MVLKELKPTQGRFIEAFLSNEYKFLLYAGSVNTGKTYIDCHLLIQLGIDYPGCRFAIVRKSSTVAKRTVWQTLKKVLAEYMSEYEWLSYKENKIDLVITINNGTTFEFVEADISKDPELMKIMGLEITAALIDEANEVAEKVFTRLMQRINRWNDNGAPAFILLTCNPAIGWVKKRFKDKYDEGTLKAPFFFQQNTIEEIPPDSLEILKNLPENEYRRYVMGDWGFSDDPAQLISYEWIRNNLCAESDDAEYLGIDAARYGADRTIFAFRKGNSLVKYEKFTKQDTNTTAQIAIMRLREKKINPMNVACDVIGLGAGVVDTMNAQGYHIKEYNAATTSDNWATTMQFKNYRAQTYWNLREGLRNNVYKIVNDADAIRELTNIKYKVENRYVTIETKDDIKKRLGFSCDLADATCIVFSMDTAIFEVSTGGKSAWGDSGQYGATGRGARDIDIARREQFFRERREDLFKKSLGF